MTLEALRNAAGAAELAVEAWEMEHGSRPSSDPEYQRRLQASADAKGAMRCAIASVTGEYSWEIFGNFSDFEQPIPEPVKTNTTTTTERQPHMPKLNEAFPSKYLTAADIEETGDLDVTIKNVEMVTLGQGAEKDTKLLITFKGMEKGFVCNKTNATTIQKVLGSDDTDDWIGGRITLKAMEVQFGKDMVMSIRVGLRKPGPKPVAAPALEPDPSDEI